MGSLRGEHPVDIGVFNVARLEDGSGGAAATFCGVLTNSDEPVEGKNRYHLCNPMGAL